MLNPGGGPRFRARPGVFAAKCPPSLSLSGISGALKPADCCCNLDSMIRFCCSFTLILRCTCSFMSGSWVTKPGDRQAMPTSLIPSPLVSRAVSGRAEPGTPLLVDVFLERSSLLGRCLAVGGGGGGGGCCCTSGEPGSFLTMILGAEPPALRELYYRRRWTD